MKTEISNGSIVLKRYELDHIPLLFEAALESRGGEFTRWMPWCHENYTIEEARQFITKSIENWENANEFDFAIFQKQSNRFLGGISLNLFNHQRKLANMGYWIRVKSQKQGVAYKAINLLTEAAFQETDLNRLEITAAVKNIASQKTAEKAGAIREGVLRELISINDVMHDAVMFSILRKDLKQRK